MPKEIKSRLASAAYLIRSARYFTAFTGAGISAQSGIQPFRGPGGLWRTYDPRMFELDYFPAHAEKAWPILRKVFYDRFRRARPSKAHEVLTRLENEGWERDGTRAPRRAARRRHTGRDGRPRLQWSRPHARLDHPEHRQPAPQRLSPGHAPSPW